MHAILEIRNLTPQERAVMDALLRSPDPVSQRELMSRMRDAPSQATMSRVMSGLIGRGLLLKEGETRGARFSLTQDARRVATDPRRRTPIPYDPDRIGGYVPNQTHWLPEEAAARMRDAVEQAGGQRLDASTYSRAIAERFLIDLSWASSNLEGNTYDHLSTEMLIKYGESASGRDRLETAMILNHKAAISLMMEGLDGAFPDAGSVQRRHVLMMRDLLDPADLGTRPQGRGADLCDQLPPLLRLCSAHGRPQRPSGQGRSGGGPVRGVVPPARGPLLPASLRGREQTDGAAPFERAAAPGGLPPLSFIGIDKTPYILGLIEFYEVGSTGLLGEAIAGSYEMTTPDYIQAVTVQRVPHGLELRERGRIAEALGRLFRDRTPDAGIPGLIDEVFGDLNEADRGKMAEILTETADRASPASAFLYGVTETDIQERNAANRGA
jgi:hypothetical protein